MATNLQLIIPRNAELCADGRTALGPDGMLIGTEAVTSGATPDIPPARGRAPVAPTGDAVLDWKRLDGFLGRQPRAALDRMVVVVPHELADDLTLFELAGRADRLGVPTQAWLSDLADDAPGEQAPSAGHRVQYLDGEGDPATRENAVSVLVHPIGGRAGDPYADAPAPVAAQALTKPHPATRMDLTGDGAAIGLAPTLVRLAYPDELTGVPADAVPTGDAVLEALGVTGTDTVPGYGALPTRLSTLRPGSTALVLADDRPYLVTRHHGTGALAVLDPAARAPGRPPLDATRVRVATLPDDGGPVGEWMNRLGSAPGAGSLSGGSLSGLGAGDVDVLAEWTLPDGTRRSVEAIGARLPLTDDLRRLILTASAAGQSVLVLRPPSAREPLADGVVAAVERRIDQLGWDGLVPAVVNLARDTPPGLPPVLDLGGADLFRQDPGAAGGLAMLGIPWVVRHPGGEHGPAAEEITEEALESAGRGRPRLAAPTPAVARLLAQPIGTGLGPLVAPHGPDLAAQMAEVAARAGRVGAYAGHDAVLNLAGQDRLGGTMRYLGAENREHGAVLDAVLGLDSSAQVTDALPHLATLAGAGLGDIVSQTVTGTLGRLMSGEITKEQATAAILTLRGKLPATGSQERGFWADKLSRMAQEQPDQLDNIGTVATAIIKCPDE